MTLVGLGKEEAGEAVRMFVLETWTTAPQLDPFGNAREAAISRSASQSVPAPSPVEDARDVEEIWRIMPEVGGMVFFKLGYTAGNRNWVAGEPRTFPVTDTSFFEIYRHDQLAEVVMSNALGKPMSGTPDYTSSVMELDGVLDGSQEVVSVVHLPIYYRQVFLPD